MMKHIIQYYMKRSGFLVKFKVNKATSENNLFSTISRPDMLLAVHYWYQIIISRMKK